MNSVVISRLVQVFPPDSPYFRVAFHITVGRPPPFVPERLQVLLNDPALFGNIAHSYAGAELSLPGFDWDPVVQRAYAHFSHPECGDDPNLRLAFQLQFPEHRRERDVIRGLLWAGATDEFIATFFGFDAEVAHLFERLFWQCRDRFGEKWYFAQLLNGRRASGANETDGLKLLQVARTTRSPEAVLEAADLDCAGGPQNDDHLALQLEENLRELAALGDSQALSLLDQFLEDHLSQAITDDLTSYCMDPNVRARIRELVKARVREYMDAQPEFTGKSPDDSK